MQVYIILLPFLLILLSIGHMVIDNCSFHRAVHLFKVQVYIYSLPYLRLLNYAPQLPWHPRKKAVTALDPAPDPDPAPTTSRVSPNPTTTSSSFDARSLDAGNKLPYPSTTHTNPPGYTGPKYTTPVVVNIGASSIIKFIIFVTLRVTFLKTLMP